MHVHFVAEIVSMVGGRHDDVCCDVRRGIRFWQDFFKRSGKCGEQDTGECYAVMVFNRF